MATATTDHLLTAPEMARALGVSTQQFISRTVLHPELRALGQFPPVKEDHPGSFRPAKWPRAAVLAWWRDHPVQPSPAPEHTDWGNR